MAFFGLPMVVRMLGPALSVEAENRDHYYGFELALKYTSDVKESNLILIYFN